MPNHLSVLGIVHTAISVLALLVALYALLRSGKVNPLKTEGKLYAILTILACVTALPIMRTGQLTGAHGLAAAILIMLPIAYYAKHIPFFGKSGYLQTVLMSTTIYFSMIPAIVETLTRVPISSPVAQSTADPIIKSCLIILTIAFVGGVTYQLRKLYSDEKIQVSG